MFFCFPIVTSEYTRNSGFKESPSTLTLAHLGSVWKWCLRYLIFFPGSSTSKPDECAAVTQFSVISLASQDVACFRDSARNTRGHVKIIFKENPRYCNLFQIEKYNTFFFFFRRASQLQRISLNTHPLRTEGFLYYRVIGAEPWKYPIALPSG